MVEMLYMKRMCCEYLLNVSECVALSSDWERARNEEGQTERALEEVGQRKVQEKQKQSKRRKWQMGEQMLAQN